MIISSNFKNKCKTKNRRGSFSFEVIFDLVVYSTINEPSFNARPISICARGSSCSSTADDIRLGSKWNGQMIMVDGNPIIFFVSTKVTFIGVSSSRLFSL
jgi:hypothetical protein